MSIIYDALKKMEDKGISLGQESQVIQPAPESPAPVPEKKKTLLLAVILLVTFGAFLFTYRKTFKKAVFSKKRMSANAAKKSGIFGFGNAVSSSKSTKPKVYSGHVLEGVIYDIEDPSAIINGRVLRKSDKIDNN